MADSELRQNTKRLPDALRANAGKGRPKGVPNKATADIKALARKHTPAAMAELARLSLNATNETARVAAIKEMFDRAYGKATQIIGGDAENPLKVVTTILLAAGDDDSHNQASA